MNASDLVMFALGLALIVGGLALIVGGGVALGWNIPCGVTRYMPGVSELPDNVTPCVGGDP
jgi:hypothetical protein